MAVSRLSCPECGTVLRPTNPVAAGKKVKCPRCSTIFVARDDDDEEDVRPRKKPARARDDEDDGEEDDLPRKKPARKVPAPAARKPAPAAKAPAKADEDRETYGYIKDEAEDEDDKPVVNYAPDESVRDLRGPAIVKLTTPATRLQMVGFIGAIGTLLFMLLLIIPAVFPIKDDAKPGEGGAPPANAEKDKKKGPAIPIFQIYGMDIYWIIELPWYNFLAAMSVLAAVLFYSAMVVAGGVKMQNLESRAWGIAAAVMAILPLNAAGLISLVALLVQYGFGFMMEDPDFAFQVQLVFGVALWLGSAVIGGLAMKVLMDEVVIAGFAYDPE